MSLANALQFPILRGSSVGPYSMSVANNGLLSRFLTRFYFPERKEKVLPRGAVRLSRRSVPVRYPQSPFLNSLGERGIGNRGPIVFSDVRNGMVSTSL